MGAEDHGLTPVRVFGIVGDPVAQVRSPEVFNIRFRARGVDAIMVPLQVPAGRLASALAGLRRVENLAGLVVTVPHKPEAARLSRPCSDRVRVAGAANVLRPVADGWESDLFDGEGFAIGLAARGIEVRGRRCAIVGAGGAGAAIAAALIERGVAALAISDLDAGRAETLARRLRVGACCPVAVARPDASSEVAINATPLGMGAGDPLPFDPGALRRDAVVAEVVMKPTVTRLLEEAGRRGLQVHEGRHMLDGQIDAIWRFFSLP